MHAHKTRTVGRLAHLQPMLDLLQVFLEETTSPEGHDAK